MSLILLGIVTFLLCQGQVLAFDTVKIIEISPSGHSIVIDKGSLDGLQLGDLGRFIFQSGGVDVPKLTDVARGEAIKIMDNRSFWYLYDLKSRENVTKGGRILFAKAQDLMRGRRKFKTLNKVSLSSKENYGNEVKEFLGVKNEQDNIPPEMIVSGDNYEKEFELDNTQVPLDHDIRSVQFDLWELSPSLQYVEDYARQFKQVEIKKIESHVEGDLLRKKETNKVGNEIADQTIDKFNNLPNGLEGLYKEQERDPDQKEFQKYLSIRPVYYQMKEELALSEVVHPRVAKKAQMGGTFWSGDMSDDQLRRYFVQSGLVREEERIRLALADLPAHEFIARFTYGMSTNTTANDPNNQAPGQHVYLAYEWHLMKTSKKLERWSVEIGYEYGASRYDMDGINVKSDESGIRTALNYYFYNLPSNINRYVWYIGTAAKFGSATLSSLNLQKEYNYNIYTIPTAQLGVKYRIRAGDENDQFLRLGFGWNAQASMESHHLSSNDEVKDNIAGSKSFNDLKFSIGMSIFL